MIKMTQKKAAFYILRDAYKRDPAEWVPAWKFVGELHVKELGIWFLMSYKTPTNGLKIYDDNPGLIERDFRKGKSGSKYYHYRLVLPTRDKIIEKDLLEFYDALKEGQRRMNLKPIIPK